MRRPPSPGRPSRWMAVGPRTKAASPHVDQTERGRVMNEMPRIATEPAASPCTVAPSPRMPDQVVLVLQGGGALGSYQAGVYQALHEAGIEPDWIIGTSIGAINASLIAGNEPANRVVKLEEFWRRMQRQPTFAFPSVFPGFNEAASYWATLLEGLPAFFKPNPLAFFGAHYPLGAEAAGFYSTMPLRQTLAELVDFPLLNSGRPRLTVGAANVRTSEMTYFDCGKAEIT